MTASSRRRSRPRDQALLDALESTGFSPFTGVVWRSVPAGRDPLVCGRSGGRWDDGTFDVLYTSESRRCAIAERRFHLFRGQPIPPSNVQYELFELRVALAAVVCFPDSDELARLGIRTAAYGALSYAEREQEYPRSQDVGEACAFLGADGLRVPSARDPSAGNLMVICEQPDESDIAVVRSHGLVTFD